PLERLDVRRHAEELRQVAAGRPARDADAVGVEVILAGVGPQPAHRLLDVVDGGGERVLRRQPVGHGRRDVALLRQAHAQAVVAVAVAGAEPAAVDAEHRREGAVALFGPGEVELQVLPVRVGVLDVRLEDDVVGHGRTGRRLLRTGRVHTGQAGRNDDGRERDQPRVAHETIPRWQGERNRMPPRRDGPLVSGTGMPSRRDLPPPASIFCNRRRPHGTYLTDGRGQWLAAGGDATRRSAARRPFPNTLTPRTGGAIMWKTLASA